MHDNFFSPGAVDLSIGRKAEREQDQKEGRNGRVRGRDRDRVREMKETRDNIEIVRTRSIFLVINYELR